MTQGYLTSRIRQQTPPKSLTVANEASEEIHERIQLLPGEIKEAKDDLAEVAVGFCLGEMTEGELIIAEMEVRDLERELRTAEFAFPLLRKRKESLRKHLEGRAGSFFAKYPEFLKDSLPNKLLLFMLDEKVIKLATNNANVDKSGSEILEMALEELEQMSPTDIIEYWRYRVRLARTN